MATLRGRVKLRDPVPPHHPAPESTFDFRLERPFRQVLVYNPSCDNNTLILRIHAWDHPDGGLHFGFILSACSIIADNAVRGFLSTSKNPDDRITAHEDDVLAVDSKLSLWFFVPGPHDPNTTINYKVVASFDDWTFPHGNIPEIWAKSFPVATPPPPTLPSLPGTASAVSSWVRQYEGSCRMSDHTSGLDSTHLLPNSFLNWAAKNEMDQYFTSTKCRHLITPTNMIALRADLHRVFDNFSFVFYPKGDEFKLVTHFMEFSKDLGPHYHNMRIRPISIVDAAFLFARFALTIFQFIPMQVSHPKRDHSKASVGSESRDDEFPEGTSSAHRKRDASQFDSDDSNGTNRMPKRHKNDPTSAGTIYTPKDSEDPGALRIARMKESALSAQRPAYYKDFARKPHKSFLEEMDFLGLDIIPDPDDGSELDFHDD